MKGRSGRRAGISAGRCFPSGRGELPFLSVLQHVTAFRRAVGRLPDPISRNPEEAVLGRWLASQADAVRREELGGRAKDVIDDALGSGWFRPS